VWFDKLLYPFKVATAWVMVRLHDVFVFLGMDDGSGPAWVLSIIGLTIIVRILIFPLFFKQIKASRGMQAIQPEMKKIQDAELNPSTFNDLTIDSFHELVRSQVDIWLSEIQKIFQYYISRTTGNRIEAIFLYGGSSKLRGLSNYFQHVLNLPTMNVDEVNIIKPTKNVKNFNPRYYINALGGLIRYE